MVLTTYVNEREIMTAPNQYGPAPEGTPQSDSSAPQTQPTQPIPQMPEYGQYAQQPPANPYLQQPQPSAGFPYGQQPATNPYAQQAPYGTYGTYGTLPQGVPGYGTMFPGVPPLNQPDYQCTFGNAVQRFFKKYAVFNGRASRREFWWVILFMVLCDLGIGIVAGLLSFISLAMPTILGILWWLATIVPYVAVTIRRLHDTNKSGWWILLPAIPYAISKIITYTVINPATNHLTATLTSAFYTGDEERLTYQFIHQLGNLAAPAALNTICLLIFLISGIVLMCGAPNPAGARFDATDSRY